MSKWSGLLEKLGIHKLILGLSIMILGGVLTWNAFGDSVSAQRAVAPTLGAASIAKLGARVSGRLAVSVKKQTVEIPDANVTLRLNGRNIVDRDVTLLNGKFDMTAPKLGKYQLCWEKDGTDGCSESFEAGQTEKFLQTVTIKPPRPVLYGESLTGDNRPCWAFDSFFDLDVSTTVKAGRKTVRANTRGMYVFLNLAPGRYDVEANCERSVSKTQVSLDRSSVRRDLDFTNRAPQLAELAARKSGKGLVSAAVGETVSLDAEARDPDGDSVKYIWRTIKGTGEVVDNGLARTDFTMSSQPGSNTAYVIAADGRGGFNYKRIQLLGRLEKLDFSGKVADEVTGAPIANAKVSVGGDSVTTDSRGWFALKAEPQNDDRYVLNIAHPNFAQATRVFDRGSRGGSYQLIRAQIQEFPAGNAISLVDTRSSGACGAPGGEGKRRLTRLDSPSLFNDSFPGRKSEKEDRKPPDAKKRPLEAFLSDFKTNCKPRGASIKIKARDLVAPRGRRPSGKIRASIATLNPERRALPGDYRAVTARGDQAELLSYSAVTADFTDSRGRKLNLKRGAKAEITIPVTDKQMRTAKRSIALWSLDTKTGKWVEEGTATLRDTPQGKAYVGTTAHFSSINMDVAGTDPDFATCARVELSSDFSGWSNLTLRAYVSYGGDSVQVKEVLLDGAQYHAIYRIPYNTGTPNSLRLELRGDVGGEPRVLLDNIINTDARPKMTGTNLWPPFPYTECGDPILLTAAPGVVPTYGDISATGLPSFLTGPRGDFNPADAAQVAADYYAAIDPASAKTTLGDWWVANGFGADGLGAGNPTFVRQPYMNHNDLGFGRDMHCLSNAPDAGDMACYVTNYGLPDQNPQNADDAVNQNPVTQGATVTMEYDAQAPAAERVQFYAYGGGVSGSQRISFADLDGFGPKPIPLLCSVCHGGGSSLSASNKVEFARFREFDLPSFRYSGNRDWDFGSANLNATELDNFASLNEQVRDTTVGQPVGDLINAWYPSGFSGAPVQPAVPTDWNTQQTAYHEVYGKTCRTCHLARDAGDPNGFFVFNSSATFSGSFLSGTVCGTGSSPKTRIMPNASITYRNFWADTARVAALEDYFGITPGTCDD